MCMPFLVAIMDLTHPLQNNGSSIGMIGCFFVLYATKPSNAGLNKCISVSYGSVVIMRSFASMTCRLTSSK